MYLDKQGNVIAKSNCDVNVKDPTLYIESSDLTKNYGESVPFTVKIVDTAGNPKNNIVVNFKINGVTYNEVTDSEGYATLNLPDLKPGEYRITTTCNDEASKTNTITILKSDIPTIVSSDMTKHYGDSDDFTVQILDNYGNPKPLVPVNFNFHGIIYHTHTDLHGYASYPTNFNPGEYNIITTCNRVSVTNKITILNTQMMDVNPDVSVKIGSQQ